MIIIVFCFSNSTQGTDEFSASLERGKNHLQHNELTAASTHLQQALDQRSYNPSANLELANLLLQLGNTFFDNKQPKKALATFTSILSISQHAAIHHNIGFTLAEQLGKYRESIPAYEKALEKDPNNAATHFCLALSLLAIGELTRGFVEYEWRWKRSADKRPRSFSYPLPHQWHGESVQKKRILIRVEQGIGDTLQFIRYAKLFKMLGATILVEVQKPIASLLALCDYIDEIIPIGSLLPPCDYQISLLDIPAVMQTNLKTIPADTPYLQADPVLQEFWKHKLAPDTNFKIGICWHGDAVHGTHKFIPLAYLAQLAQVPNVSLYSLQKVTGLDQLTAEYKDIIHTFTDFDDTHGNFMDTAAIMKHLDLVITVDTSIAHLAGGLRVPVWVILPFPAEWRWLVDRHNSPWYPTMHLLRQSPDGDWQEVMDTIIAELKKISR